MTSQLLIFFASDNVAPYGKSLIRNMFAVLLVLLCYWPGLKQVQANVEYFPGLRKPPPSQPWTPNSNDNSILLDFIEQQARIRFLQHLQQLKQEQTAQKVLTEQFNDVENEPDFTYKLPEKSAQSPGDRGEHPFAFHPSDPGYFDVTAPKLSSNNIEAPNNDDVPIKSSDGVSYFKLKAPMHVNPKPNDVDNNAVQENRQSNSNRSPQVVQKALNTDNQMSMYVVALIAGISAAVTVALIALGLAWYTLHRKIKAAADVEYPYPDYGITGPSKDLMSPTDKKLAQSAQIYHYQHQKQQQQQQQLQGISSEGKSNGADGNDGFSDLEGEFETEYGDYTVYECPGFAPTGEMEVKNPLFTNAEDSNTESVAAAKKCTTKVIITLDNDKDKDKKK